MTEAAFGEVQSLIDGRWANRDEHFGNRRAIRNILERLQQEHANRLAANAEPTRKELRTIDIADVVAVASDLRGNHGMKSQNGPDSPGQQ